MVEPLTVNKLFTAPLTGDLPSAWGTAALNANFQAFDGLFGGVASISLSVATTIALSAPAGVPTPGAGPNQQSNALIKFTGSLTGNAVIQFSIPGFYIVDNRCTVNTFYVSLAPSTGTGNVIGAPPGRKCHVFFDGTSMDYVNAPDPGAALDLHGATALPPWMTACTVLPYLIKDGTVYTASVYPALAAMLGSSFGGNGITTFGVPDERNRARIGLDTNGPGTFSNRVTLAGSGITGTTMGAAGGDELLQAHVHTAAVTDPGHTHVSLELNASGASIGAPRIGGFNLQGIATAVTRISVLNSTTGAGAGQNMPPTIVSFLPLIKT